LKLKRDNSLSPIQESVSRKPLKATGSVSIGAGASATLTVSIPDNEMWFIKGWAISKGTNVTVNSIKVDSEDTGLVASLTDTVPEYGALLTGDRIFTASGSNAGTAAENLDVTIKGHKLVI
jgi:hypothetical protein